MHELHAVQSLYLSAPHQGGADCLLEAGPWSGAYGWRRRLAPDRFLGVPHSFCSCHKSLLSLAQLSEEGPVIALRPVHSLAHLWLGGKVKGALRLLGKSQAFRFLGRA